MKNAMIRDILYEAPGPKTRRRVFRLTAAAALLLAGLLFMVARQFYVTGQLGGRYWAFFGKATTWRFLGQGLLVTVEAAVTGALISFALGFLLMLWGRQPAPPAEKD